VTVATVVGGSLDRLRYALPSLGAINLPAFISAFRSQLVSIHLASTFSFLQATHQVLGSVWISHGLDNDVVVVVLLGYLSRSESLPHDS
jgi:hypothetical protein